MTEIEQKALALLNKVNTERNRKAATFVFVDRSSCVLTEALCRAIEQHEAFKREVSDEIAKLGCWPDTVNLQRFILPKPDPLVEAWLDAFPGNHREDSVEECEKIRAALAKRGLEVREIEK